MAARKRHDPPSTPADGRRVLDQLSGADPDRHYVVANPNDEATGVEMYKALGYEFERKRADGPRWAGGGGASEGEVMTRLGGMLMSISAAGRAEIEEPWKQANDGFDRQVLKGGHLSNDHLRGGMALRPATEAEERLLDR